MISTANIFVGIQHAAFASERAATLGVLLEKLGPSRPFAPEGDLALGWRIHIERETERRGAWTPTRACIEAGIASGAAWIALLNDDAVPVLGFEDHLRRLLDARERSDRPDLPLCLYAQHERTSLVPEPGGLYSTPDGYVGVGAVLSREAAIAMLEWHDRAMVCPMPNGDAPITLWAIQTRRQILVTVPSLVEHGLPNTSLRGSEEHTFRRAAAPPDPIKLAAVDWSRPPAALGRRWGAMQWKSLFLTYVEEWDLEAAYQADRHGQPVSSCPRLAIATPLYREPDPAHSIRVTIGKKERSVDARWWRSLQAAIQELGRRKIDVDLIVTDGCSLVTLARHAIQHLCLRTPATHFLLWDDDLELRTPEAAADMLEALVAREKAYNLQLSTLSPSGSESEISRPSDGCRLTADGAPAKPGLLGGVYPMRDDSGKMVGGELLNLREDVRASKQIRVDADQTTDASLELGTGFLMVSRRMIVDLCMKNMQRFYTGDSGALKGEPMWALFETEVVSGRYLSEDFGFCRLARLAGYEIRAYLDAEFLHHGPGGIFGANTVRQAWGLPVSTPGLAPQAVTVTSASTACGGARVTERDRGEAAPDHA